MLEGLLNMLQPAQLLTLVIGAVGGAIVGGLPGLTATMAIALLVPFTFTLGPMTGFVAIGALYAGARYGDSIPACLINTPGTPSALATTFDGFPLTQKGKGQHALICSGIASAVGSLIGGCALLLLSPPLARFALRFGPPELFWIGVFGLTMIASLAGGSLLKGLAGAALGMLVGTVGIAPALAHARYTFGVPALLGGINIVAALMGLFAIPQALRLVESHRTRPRIVDYRETRGVFREIALNLARAPMTLLRSCGIGTLVGLLPAAGGPIASLIAYNEAKRWSRHPEEFGKGSMEGLTAAESANNAAAPASMIPLLALGIPASAPAAVALGALMLHGLQPGQALYAQHADIVYTFIWSMILAGIVILLMTLWLSRYLSRIAEFPVYLLAPLILLLSVVGAFAIRNNALDVAIMLAFGLAGYVLDKLGFSAGPIVLGLVLGPVVESGLVSSLAMVRTGHSGFEVFLFRPISAVLVLLSLVSAAWPGISRRISSYGLPAGGGSAAGEPQASRAPWMLAVNADVAGGVLVLAIAFVALALSRGGTFQVWIYPRVAAGVLAMLGIGLVAGGVIQPRMVEIFDMRLASATVLPFAAGIVLYGFLLPRAGFVATTIVMYSLAMFALRRQFTVRSAVLSLAMGAAFTFVLHQVFARALHVPLPRGAWW